jgi:hypothetical protein
VKPNQWVRELRHKTHMVALGATLALSAGYLNGSCIAAGQCAGCGGNCAVRLPVLALPLLVDGLITVFRHRWRRLRTGRPETPGRRRQGRS